MNIFENTFGFLVGHPFWTIGVLVLGFLALGFAEASLLTWTIAFGLLLYGLGAPTWLWITAAALALVFNVRALRRRLVTSPIMGIMRALKFLPTISETERVAIEAGTVWVDGELFSGRPDFDRLLKESYPELTEEEQSFLDGPVEEVCRLTDDWDVLQRRDLSPETWQYLKDQRFFGLIIPKEYGGMGFSASANSAVVTKISSRSMVLGVTVMVPNSLGPAELLTHYGTEKQKEFYLPRLARGIEVPAFALTEPNAGSDAGAISSSGVVYKGDDGELYLRLNWDKRYITLAGVSTVLGLAFQLRDPDNLLGKGTDLGITCALVPSDAPGVDLSLRHDPLGVPFYNCPTSGKDVVVKVEDAIIGGREGAGRGWQMLMESLAAGRGISLPASSTAGTKMAARAAGAYAAVRKQFGLPIGKFEGIEEPLARLGGWSYLLEAARRYTCGGLDTGAKPAVVTAMAKYNFTEIFRKAVNDAMDIMGGAAISRGPRNSIANAYAGIPVSITVEGANILTRTLMVFGQGAIRCHPYAYQEITSAAKRDVAGFDEAFWGHIGHVVRNAARSAVLSLSRGYLATSPISGPSRRYVQRLAWSSASFAITADLAMGLLGGDLKRKETLTGRFSDVFSWMYLGTAVLRRFEAEGRRPEDLPLFRWSMEYALGQIQQGFDGLFRNMEGPAATRWVFRGPLAWWSRLNSVGNGPSDDLGHAVARILQTPGAQRDALTNLSYLPLDDLEEPIGRLENAFRLSVRAEEVARKIKKAVRARKLPKAAPAKLVDPALAAGIISESEARLVREAEAARADAIAVDSFTNAEYFASAARRPEDREARPPAPAQAYEPEKGTPEPVR